MSKSALALADDKEFEQLVDRANIPNARESDVANLRRYLREHPECWDRLTTVATAAKEHALMSLGTSALTELTRAGIAHLRNELGYQGAPMLERLLIDHIMLAWINYHYVQFAYDERMVGAGQTVAQATYWEKRLAIAQRRYLRSIETLARVRRMKLPALQVNIGRNQVNIGA